MITDFDRIAWLEKGRGVVCITNKNFPKGFSFSANFENQDWTEHETVRAAIDEGIKNEQ